MRNQWEPKGYFKWNKEWTNTGERKYSESERMCVIAPCKLVITK